MHNSKTIYDKGFIRRIAKQKHRRFIRALMCVMLPLILSLPRNTRTTFFSLLSFLDLKDKILQKSNNEMFYGDADSVSIYLSTIHKACLSEMNNCNSGRHVRFGMFFSTTQNTNFKYSTTYCYFWNSFYLSCL